jgi:DNA recombination protein RmuC
MNVDVVMLLTLAGLLIVAATAWLAGHWQISALFDRKAELEQELGSLKSQVARQQSENSALLAAKAATEATLESERRSADEKLHLLTTTSEEMKTQFKALASTALESNNASFLHLASTTLQNYQTQAAGDLAQKEQAVRNLVDPIAQSLASMNEQIQALEQTRSQAYGSLSTQVVSLTETQKALYVETSNLVKALREPQTRGRWGEMQLRRVLELAGMLEYCDFEEQVSVTLEDRRLRPDVVVRLPGAKNIVIDAKAPLAGYLNALEAQDEATRNSCLLDHARHIKKHIDDLAAKAYWAQFQPTPEFVLLFLPGEVFFRAAVMTDPELLEYGDGKVVLTSPMTLIAVLKTIAYGWNQKNLAESARRISEAGTQLYYRLCTMTGYVENLGKKLEGAVKSYNEMLSSMEKRVFPAGRRLSELDRSLAAGNLPNTEQVESTPRQLESPDWQLEAEPEPFSLVSENTEPTEK